MKNQKTEFNWKLYEFSRQELGLSTLAPVGSQDEFTNPHLNEDYDESVNSPKTADEMRA